MSFKSLLPTTGLAPYVNSFSLFAAPSQNLQQFPQHLSNPPGQTVDWFFNVISVIYNLNVTIINITTQSFTPPTPAPPLYTYAVNAVGLLQAIVSQVQADFSNDPKWSTPILPYKGYAANNAVQSAYSPINVEALAQSLGTRTNSAEQLAFILYYWLYAFNQEVTYADEQINHFTYSYLVSKSVTYNSQTKSVQDWISELQTDLTTIVTNLPGDFFTSSASGWNLISSTIFSNITTATVETLEHIPLVYLGAPYPASSPFSSNAAAITQQTLEAPIILLIAFSGTLYNVFSAISPALNKVTLLYDPKTYVYVFQDAAQDISDAFSTYSGLIDALNQSVVSANSASVHSALSLNDFSYAITYTQKSSRNSSVDINRISGSLVPTLNNVLQYWLTVQALASYIKTQSTTYSPALLYSAAFTNALDGIITNVSIGNAIGGAISSFGPDQLSIHYSRWSQNLTNI